MIKIKKSEMADSRTCDYKTVTKEELLNNSIQHIDDVYDGMKFFSDKIEIAGGNHDHTKMSGIDHFYDDFKTGFKETGWYENHQDVERHHLSDLKYVQDDVNLIDVLEMITDCVMAGLARSGEYRHEEVSLELLKKAYENTVQLLLDNVTVSDTK